MKALVYAGEGLVRLEDRPRPQVLEPTDVILRVTAAAICGTDLHLVEGKVPGFEEGTVLGHEFVGVVEDAGDAVRNVEPGKRYVASMQTACGACRACSRHDYRNCPSNAFFGMGYAFGNLEGGQAEYVRVPLADMTLAEIPDDVPDEVAVLVSDILPTAYTAMLRGGVRPGDTVAVVGAGPVGQLSVMCARLLGASQVFAVDMVAERLREAEALGAVPVDAGRVDPSDYVAERTGLLGVDVVVEAVGNQSALNTAWSLGRTGAVIALVGLLTEEEWPIGCGDSWLKVLDVRPVIGDSVTHRWDLLRLIRSGHLKPGQIISHVLRLDDAVEAYQMFQNRTATKIILTP
jgi:threonine dehydrogenase-like Zn-dependent dehydrogenase